MSLRGSQLGQDLRWFENLVTGANKMHLNCHHLLFACLVICRTGSIGRIGDERCKITTINTLYFTALHIMDQEQLRHCSPRHALLCSSCTALPNHYTTLQIIDDVLHCSTDHHLSCRPPICFRHRYQPPGQQDTLLHFYRHIWIEMIFYLTFFNFGGPLSL